MLIWTFCLVLACGTRAQSLSESFSFFWGGGGLWIHYYWSHYLAYCTSSRLLMMMSVEQLVEWLAGKPEIFGENLPQCHLVHHKSHMIWTGARTRAAAVWIRALTAWAMARPGVFQLHPVKPTDMLCYWETGQLNKHTQHTKQNKASAAYRFWKMYNT
jgi:hypothetical protein